MSSVHILEDLPTLCFPVRGRHPTLSHKRPSPPFLIISIIYLRQNVIHCGSISVQIPQEENLVEFIILTAKQVCYMSRQGKLIARSLKKY